MYPGVTTAALPYYILVVVGLVNVSSTPTAPLHQPISTSGVSSHYPSTLLHLGRSRDGLRNEDEEYRFTLPGVFRFLNRVKFKTINKHTDSKDLKEESKNYSPTKIKQMSKRSSPNVRPSVHPPLTPNATSSEPEVHVMNPVQPGPPIACPVSASDCQEGRPNSVPTLNRHHNTKDAQQQPTQVPDKLLLTSFSPNSTPVNRGVANASSLYAVGLLAIMVLKMVIV